ncbi:hypothetical protein Y032_0028g1761 [Ancylostoma ceylanicum]|uniref:Uncharacterized protein n=1 Tax=Ancylostoma ceylanicum TaxID=53326 RepID=A0A016USS9_9BILA|nr:hypothetical protein Y032_0028g1761 [Ancylostoma ceylanicum]
MAKAIQVFYGGPRIRTRGPRLCSKGPRVLMKMGRITTTASGMWTSTVLEAVHDQVDMHLILILHHVKPQRRDIWDAVFSGSVWIVGEERAEVTHNLKSFLENDILNLIAIRFLDSQKTVL